MIKKATAWCSEKVSAERSRVRSWNESVRWVMIMLIGRKILVEKEVGGGKTACDS